MSDRLRLRVSELPTANTLAPGDLVLVVQPTGTTPPLATRKATVQQVLDKVGSVTGSPVLSVAGKTGAVTLVPGDVAGLVTALDERSPVNHRHHSSDVDGLDALYMDGGSF